MQVKTFSEQAYNLAMGLTGVSRFYNKFYTRKKATYWTNAEANRGRRRSPWLSLPLWIRHCLINTFMIMRRVRCGRLLRYVLHLWTGVRRQRMYSVRLLSTVSGKFGRSQSFCAWL